MRQKFSNFLNLILFIIKYAKVRFIGRVLQNFTFHDHFALFSYVHGLQRDVYEIMPITCPAFHVQPMSSRFTLSDSYMYQNILIVVKFENFNDGTLP